jgi:hypothetical protein
MPRRLVKLKTAGEWQDGDHTMLHVIFELSLEMHELGNEPPPDIAADFDHSGSRGVMADPETAGCADGLEQHGEISGLPQFARV